MQHTYGNIAMWHIPGGGFRPGSEAAEVAVQRELQEELGARLISPIFLADYYTESQGKRDTVFIYFGTLESDKLVLNPEIRAIRWASIAELADDPAFSAITRFAAHQYQKRAETQHEEALIDR